MLEKAGWFTGNEVTGDRLGSDSCRSSGLATTAARELTAILDAHRDLPIIGWTIGTAGARLVGNVSALACGGRSVRPSTRGGRR